MISINDPALTANIIEKIPSNGDDAIGIEQLCNTNDIKLTNQILGVLILLQTLGVIKISISKDGENRFKATSHIASYFLKSLACYIRNDFKIVSNWDGRGVGRNPKALNSGARLLFLMDERRVFTLKDPTPSRQIAVSIAIINKASTTQAQPIYLVHRDSLADKYQFISRRKTSPDLDDETVMIQGFEQKLQSANLVYPDDYEIKKIASDIIYYDLSNTYGAYTEYNFTVFHATIHKTNFDIGPNHKWLTYEELRSNRNKTDRITFGWLDQLEKHLPNSLKELPLSIQSNTDLSSSDNVAQPIVSKEEVEQQQELLSTYRRTLSIFVNQQARLGGSIYSPPGIINSINEARAEILRIKNALRAWDIQVVDMPDD